jgi:hypothetical protein
LLDGVEVGVDDVVEHAVQQVGDAVRGQMRGVVPALDDLFDVEALIGVHGHERVLGQEDADLVAADALGARVELDRVHHREQVRRVVVHLGSLALVEDILDGEGVQAKFLAHGLKVPGVLSGQVEPDDMPVLAQVVGNLLHREVLAVDLAVAVTPGAHHAIRLRAET